MVSSSMSNNNKCVMMEINCAGRWRDVEKSRGSIQDTSCICHNHACRYPLQVHAQFTNHQSAHVHVHFTVCTSPSLLESSTPLTTLLPLLKVLPPLPLPETQLNVLCATLPLLMNCYPVSMYLLLFSKPFSSFNIIPHCLITRNSKGIINDTKDIKRLHSTCNSHCSSQHPTSSCSRPSTYPSSPAFTEISAPRIQDKCIFKESSERENCFSKIRE